MVRFMVFVLYGFRESLFFKYYLIFNDYFIFGKVFWKSGYMEELFRNLRVEL